MNHRHGAILFLFALVMMFFTPSRGFGSIPSRGANSATTFGYSGSGECLWKQTSTTNGLQIWIGNIYEEKNGKILYHIYAGSLLVCTLDAAGTVVDYYQSDNLHSSSILTSGTGGTAQQYEYTAYGQDRYINSATAFPVTRRFTSQTKDEETGLMYYGARYYDPELGRFIQADTEIGNIFNPQNLNRYSYAANNPQKYIDPTGHWEWYPWTYNWMPNSWVNYMGGGGSAPRPAPSVAPMSNLGMLQSELGGYDASDLHAAANVGKAVASLNPVVGTFNSAYTAGTGNDAYDPGQTVSRGERIQAGGATAAALLGAFGMVGRAEKEGGMLYRGVPGNGTAKANLGKQGVAVPRGTSLDSQVLEDHVKGYNANAGVTSWTTDREIDRSFAGSDGTIIQVSRKEVADKIVPRPPVQKYGAEKEVLLKGTIQGRPTDP